MDFLTTSEMKDHAICVWKGMPSTYCHNSVPTTTKCCLVYYYGLELLQIQFPNVKGEEEASACQCACRSDVVVISRFSVKYSNLKLDYFTAFKKTCAARAFLCFRQKKV